MVRVTAGRSRSVIPPWAAIRCAASSWDPPRPTIRVALRSRIAGDEPDLGAHLGEAALDQLDRLDHDDVGVFLVGDRDRRQDPRPDSRMDDRLQVAERGRIREDDAPERSPVQGAIVQQEVLPEPLRDGVEGRLPAIEHVARHPVRVDHDDARPLSQPAPRSWTCRNRWVP